MSSLQTQSAKAFHPTLGLENATVSRLTRLFLIAGLLFGSVNVLANPANQNDDESEKTFPGGIYQWQPPAKAERIRFTGKAVLQIGKTALIGLPVSQPLGEASLSYMLAGRPMTHYFDVVDKAYTKQYITLKNRQMVNPNPQQMERIHRESKLQTSLYQQISAAKNLNQGFILPLRGVTTSLFGHRRFFNGEPRSPHSGLDIAADAGTPIIAPAEGAVVLVDDLYFNGKTVFLDHGQGLITMYCHLSEHKVVLADSVNQGDVIGLVGATGRATGPHLHWSVSLNGVRVDPLEFQKALSAAITNN
jgi:murein DD-endopeptidase MepM/ murein hydrolase activator NlpD